MQPSVGSSLLYRLSVTDADQVNRSRANGLHGASRYVEQGLQQHVGNHVVAGEVVPFVVVRVWPHEFGQGKFGVNGQALLDGNDSLWVTSAGEGPGAGQWSWPERVE